MFGIFSVETLCTFEKPLACHILIYGKIIKIKEDTWETFGKLSSVGTPESREFRPLSWSLSVWRDDHDYDDDDDDLSGSNSISS